MQRVFFRVLLVSVLLMVPFLIWLAPHTVGVVFGFIFFFAPLWLPFLLAAILVPLWLTYVRSQYVASVPHTVLELKPGDDMPKTARAMELIFYSLYHRVEVTRLMAISVGQVRLPWSFEIFAHKGTVRFFIRIPTSHRAAIESRIRAEYRDVDIDEVRDYARTIPYSPLSMHLESREYRFTKPDPYPIKTYEEWEKAKKPEDPLVSVLEKLVGIGDEEYFLISLLVRPHQRERQRLWEEPADTLHQDAQYEIASLVGSSGNPNSLPENKKKLVAAIEAGLKKPSFDCGIRAVYAARRGHTNEEHMNWLETLFTGFEEGELNGFKAFDARERLSWPLSDIAAAIPGFADWHMFQLFRRRVFFAPPYYGEAFVLNTAELATLFHLPYITRASPLGRNRGKRLEPPDNLPVVPV